MPYILHIETSSTVCSVAISKQAELIAIKEINNGYTHAENLHVFMQELLEQAHLQPKNLQAICVSSGPGSYTGLRIGFATAKGLAFALNIPLIVVNTLQALSYTASLQSNNKDIIYCPLIDARRMEVYCGLFDENLNELIPSQSLVLDEESIILFNKHKPIYFFGDGMPKAKELLSSLPNSHFINDMYPSAMALIHLAYKKYLASDFENTAYAEPAYIKDFFFTTSKK